MESDHQSHMEDVQLTSATSSTGMDSNFPTSDCFDADAKNSTTVEATNGTGKGVAAVSTETLNGVEPVSGPSQVQRSGESSVDNTNNENDDGEEYNAIDLGKATWSYLRRSRCLGTSLRHSEQAYLSFGESQIEDNHNDKSDDDEEEEEEDTEKHKNKSPSHLADYFENIQKRFTADKKIMEYERGTCWIEPPDPVFPLQSSADSHILLKPRLFIWAPNLLQPVALTCPKCKSQLSSQGWNKSPHARGVLDVDRSFFIMSTRFRCARCPVTLNAHDMNILKQLPMHLQEAFPAYMTHKSAISKTLVDVMRPLMNIMSPKGFTRYLKEIHNARMNRLRVQCQKNLMIKKSHGLSSDSFGGSKLAAPSNQKKFRAAVTKDVPQLKAKVQPILPNISRATPQFIPIYIPTSRPAQFIPPPPLPIRIAPLKKPTASAMRPILPATRDHNKHPASIAPSMMMRMPILGVKRRITAIGVHRRTRTCKTCNSQVCPGRAQSKRCKFANSNIGVSDALPTKEMAVPDTTTADGTPVSEHEQQQASPDASDKEQSQPSAIDVSLKTPEPASNSHLSPVQETNDIPSPVQETSDIPSPVHEASDIPSPVHETSDIPSPVHVTSDMPGPVHETSDIPNRPTEVPASVTRSLRPFTQRPLLPSSSDKMAAPRLTYPVPSKRRPLRFTQYVSTAEPKENP